MNKSTLLLLLSIMIAFSCSSPQAVKIEEVKLSTPNPSEEAVALYRYLHDMNGKVILSGQMWAPWGIDEIDYIYEKTGKYPALRGQDFIHERDNEKEVQLAIEWWKKGGIPSIMWHWGAPSVGEGYRNSQVEINIDNCFIEGTDEYNDFWRELKAKAIHLEALRDANIPVLWRPFHELNGHWFWYGKQGPERFKKLWKTMYDYYVHERGINNLIWVLCYTGEPDPDWYPGDEYVDLAGPDTYASDNSPQLAMFNETKEITNNQYPIPFHECGIIPNPDQCLAQDAMWSWWMVWHTGHLTRTEDDYLKYVYHHDLIVTLDEVPDIMALYNWDQNCAALELSGQIKTDNEKWENTTLIMHDTGTKAIFKATSNTKGTWSWSGYGTSGNSNTQTVKIDGKGTALAMFTTKCGATSSIAFHVGEAAEPAQPTGISPNVQIDGGIWRPENEVTVNAGQTVIFGPHPYRRGSWKWSGDMEADTREITIVASESLSLTATYTNEYGVESSMDFKVNVTAQ